MLIAYFCAEFALINDMPSYAGGLGILAGDFVLESARQKFPVVGISLYYQKGQNPKIVRNSNFGLKLVKKNWRERLLIEILIEDRAVLAQVWQWKKDDVSVYFLDTNIKENKEEKDRLITEQLYTEDRDRRLEQELILGVGGVRLLKALNLKPDLYHLNEGHSAFLGLELIGEKVKSGLDFNLAVEAVKSRTVFTNHTLVLEGQELFAFDALTRMTTKLCQEFNLDINKVIKLGQNKESDTLFSMTTLALKIASLTNAVSKIHGEKARELWSGYPLIHITNGIYIPRWDKVKNSDIVKVHKKNEKELLKLIRETHGDDWNEEALLVGWSRRFVPYKRPLALLEDIERLKNLACHFAGKIHIIYSAPLSEDDADKNEFLKKIYELMNGELKGLITFIPNYKIDVAETIVAGCDVWLNTPIVGREACGTSGMKAALNGTLNISTNDGWIAEIPLNSFGWTLDDQNITASLLDTLEHKVLPAYSSDAWKSSMRKSRNLILKEFGADRMLKEYQDKLYAPVLNKNKKEVIAFDIDGTLAVPRQPIKRKTASLLVKLLENKKVAVISGSTFEQMKKQILDQLSKKANLNNLILLPTKGAEFWTFDKTWQKIFSKELTEAERVEIEKAINEVDQSDPELKDNQSFGREIQDRGTEVTYSALGEDAPVKIKQAWDPDYSKRIALNEKLMQKLPNFDVKIGGTTSIDITAKGMDKAYGIKTLLDYLKLEKSQALFFGDAVYPNGNDFPVLEMGVETIKVSGPKETVKILKRILDN